MQAMNAEAAKVQKELFSELTNARKAGNKIREEEINKIREELKKEFGELSLVPGKFTNGMSIYCGTKFRVTPEIKDVIWQTANESEYILFKKDGYIFTAAMLKPNKKEL